MIKLKIEGFLYNLTRQRLASGLDLPKQEQKNDLIDTLFRIQDTFCRNSKISATAFKLILKDFIPNSDRIPFDNYKEQNLDFFGWVGLG